MLNDTGMAALQTFFQKGGVYTGVHSGSACLYNDTNYQQAVGGEWVWGLYNRRGGMGPGETCARGGATVT